MTDDIIGSRIWIVTEGVFGELLSMGAFVSKVRYFLAGIEYEEFIDNNDFIIWRDSSETDSGMRQLPKTES